MDTFPGNNTTAARLKTINTKFFSFLLLFFFFLQILLEIALLNSCKLCLFLWRHNLVWLHLQLFAIQISPDYYLLLFFSVFDFVCFIFYDINFVWYCLVDDFITSLFLFRVSSESLLFPFWKMLLFNCNIVYLWEDRQIGDKQYAWWWAGDILMIDLFTR